MRPGIAARRVALTAAVMAGGGSRRPKAVDDCIETAQSVGIDAQRVLTLLR